MSLKRQILQHLQDHGATSKKTLYIHFDPSMTGQVLTILQDLEAGQYIELDDKGMLTITPMGVNLLLMLI